MQQSMIRRGFLLGGVTNLGGIMLFSKGLTNEVLLAADPEVMSRFGLCMILVWGLAYIGAAFVEKGVAWIAAAFAVEKLFYVANWVHWHSGNELAPLWQQDRLAGAFYAVYGVVDLAFLLFFLGVFYTQRRQ